MMSDYLATELSLQVDADLNIIDKEKAKWSQQARLQGYPAR